MDQEVADSIQELIDAVVRAGERRMNEEREALDAERELMNHLLDQQDSFDEEGTTQTVDQIGGASVRITKVWEEKVDAEYSKHFNFIKLDVVLPTTITADPNGPENFGEMIVELVAKFKPKSANDETRVGITFFSPDFEDGPAVGLSITPIEKVASKEIVKNLELLSQSSRSPLQIKSPKLQVMLKYITPPDGSGKRPREFGMKEILESDLYGKRKRTQSDEYEDNDDDFDARGFLDEAAEGSEEEESDFELDLDAEVMEGNKKRSNIMQNNVSYDCLPHAIYQSWMYQQSLYGDSMESREEGRKMYRQSLKKSDLYPNRCNSVYEAVRELKRKAGITKNRNFGYKDIKEIQKKVFKNELQIIAIVKDQSLPYFAGKYVGENKTIAIYLEEVNGEGHYSGVRKLPALLGTKFYCCRCLVRCGSFATHYNCRRMHQTCGSVDCISKPDEDLPLSCVKCEVVFRSEQCLENHLKKGPRGGKSRCEHTKMCKKCGTAYYTNKSKVDAKHDCGKKWCSRCQTNRAIIHHCIMSKAKKPAKLTRKRFAYDFESMVGPNGEQIPILFIAVHYCASCSGSIPKNLREALNTTCKDCSLKSRGIMIQSIKLEDDAQLVVDVATKATEWIFSEEHKGFVGIAHNASGYDAQFILKSLVSSNKATPKVITAGSKIIYLRHKQVKLVDSLKYLTMSLAAVGKAFQIPTQKGDFPIGFIKEENFDYVGPLPEDKFYNLKKKPQAAREKLKKYLDEERSKGTEFNFFEEIVKYCYNDVFILASALAIFEKEFEAATKVVLFEESVTAASAAMMAFRRTHLNNERTIVLDARPSVSVRASIESQKYIAWFGDKKKQPVKISTTTGEVKIGNYSVDGFIDKCDEFKRGLVIEFFGCYWHAHKCRYSALSTIAGKQAADIWAADKKRIEFLEEHHDVHLVWECEVKAMCAEDPAMADFFAEYEPLDLMEMENALAGGRTECYNLLAKNVDCRYMDVNSMYPAAMKYEEFPVGPPEDISRTKIRLPITHSGGLFWRGFITGRFLPPRNLKLPLLPLKVTGKLMFALCLTCAKTLHQGPCKHTDKERSFTGTYTTVEVKKALELGYVITNVFHAVHYQSWAKNDENGVGGLFTSYVNSMMVLKTYASGFPESVKTVEDQDKFIEDHMKQGIDVRDKSKFIPSPGARLSSKLVLNSLWGKFAQRVDRVNTAFHVSPEQFWKMFNDTSVIMEDVWTFRGTVMVQHRSRAESLQSLSTGALHIAAHVPSYGRLHLYRLLEKIGADNNLYSDTDSAIYKMPASGIDPLKDEIGPFLGQVSSELKGKMRRFVTTGAKSYAYEEVMPDGSVEIKVKSKGITLSSEAAKKVTLEKMEQMVEEVLTGVQRSVVEVPQQQVRRNRNHDVFFKDTVKKFRFTFDKRRILPDGSTLPYGYCDK